MDGNQNQRATDAHLVGAAAVDEAVASRRSIRRFLPTPVSREMVDHLLTVASRAPSGTNMQPWQVCALAGKQKAALQDALVDASLNHGEEHAAEFPYYPEQFPEPYKSRRRKIGWDLYGLLDITRADKDKMRQQMARNFLFFDAPVGLIFTIDRVLEIGSWLDYGMFMENIMVAAREHGLHTCPQVAFSQIPHDHSPAPRHPRRANRHLRHVDRLRRPRGDRKHPGNRTRTAGEIHPLFRFLNSRELLFAERGGETVGDFMDRGPAR